MFKKIPNGTLEKISNGNGFEYECWIPPVGFGIDAVTGKLEPTDVIKRSELPEEQYWERTPLPKDWFKMRQEEIITQKSDPNFFHPVIDRFESQEWRRRLRGCWFYNNGVPTYVTGTHYLYLNWWKYQGKFLDYRDSNRKVFYIWDYCVEDPNSLGLIEFTKRKDGKTGRSGVILYEYISRTKNKHGGIQSKTDDDAEEVFKKAVVAPWRSLPDFFRPTYDTAKGDNPKESLSFFETSVRGAKALSKQYEEGLALESWIDFKPMLAEAYDGPELHRYVSDECGKLKKISIVDRHNVVMFCSEVNNEYIGKQYYTTTVEEMEAGGAEFKNLVDNSNPAVRNQLGRTNTGLYTFFLPSDETMNFDRYGFPDKIRNREIIKQRREGLKNDSRALSSYIRKNPLTFQECFRVDGDKCLYNSENLNNQRDFLSWNQDIVERGNFMWKEGRRDTEVVWKKSSNGRWLMLKGFNPKKEEINQVEQVGNQFYPKNNIRFGSAVDPYDHNQTEDNYKRSMAASLVKQKNNPYNFSDPMIGAYICRYYARPATAAAMYEDMIMQCRYFGISILAESNRPGIISYFRDRNHGAFLMHLPGYKEPGIPSTQENKRQASELIEATIEDNCDKIFFIDVIEDLLVFDINKTQKFDLAMAALWTEIACDNRLFRLKEKSEVTEVTELFKRHKIA